MSFKLILQLNRSVWCWYWTLWLNKISMEYCCQFQKLELMTFVNLIFGLNYMSIWYWDWTCQFNNGIEHVMLSCSWMCVSFSIWVELHLEIHCTRYSPSIHYMLMSMRVNAAYNISFKIKPLRVLGLTLRGNFIFQFQN